jgi:lipopolysaccharide export system protein LptA
MNPNRTHPSRRDVLRSSIYAGTAALLPTWARSAGANGDVRIAVVGFNGRGAGHISSLLKIPGCRIVALCDVDSAVLVMTGRDLRLITQNEVLTARDSLEYWSQKRMAVARGGAVVLTNDARRIAADTLVAYTADAPATSGTPPPTKPARPGGAPGEAEAPNTGKLEKVEAYGNVSIRTPTDMATGDRAIYVPDIGIARLGGSVRITRGQNQLNGAQAVVNMKTGVARLLGTDTDRVQGLVLPNDPSGRAVTADPAQAATPPAQQAQ